LTNKQVSSIVFSTFEEVVKIRVYVVDDIMGSGKTKSAIQKIQTEKRKKFLVVTPYLSEVSRYSGECRMISPKGDSKIENVKWLLYQGVDIVCTHALFHKFDNECRKMIQDRGYTLIMDECINPVGKYKTDLKFNQKDYNELKRVGLIVESRHGIQWVGHPFGAFNSLRNAMKIRDLYYDEGQYFYSMFPIRMFYAFREVYILTYKFEGQPLSWYFKLNEVKYKKMWVKNSKFTLESQSRHLNLELFNIINKHKINDIGSKPRSLCKLWYEKASPDQLETLRRNTQNYFNKVVTSKSKQNMWTTFMDYQEQVSGGGYKLGFVSLNMLATNKYSDKSSIAYLVNRYVNPYDRKFFASYNVEIDEDEYALSEMLQFIWRSRIRKGETVNIYVPSIRMRTLFNTWLLNFNS